MPLRFPLCRSSLPHPSPIESIGVGRTVDRELGKGKRDHLRGRAGFGVGQAAELVYLGAMVQPVVFCRMGLGKLALSID